MAATRNCLAYSTVFLASWSALAWWLLTDQGWNTSQLSTVGALGLGYLVGGLITAAAFAMQILWTAHRPRRPVLRIRYPQRRGAFVPAVALNRVAKRR